MSDLEQMNNHPKVNRLFLFLGIFSLLLTPFDIVLEHDYFGSALNIAWGGLFIFLATKERLKSKNRLSAPIINVILFILVGCVIIAASLKFLHKL